MTQIPLFIPNRAAHYREAALWADRLPHYTEADKKRAVKIIVKHLKEAIQCNADHPGK